MQPLTLLALMGLVLVGNACSEGEWVIKAKNASAKPLLVNNVLLANAQELALGEAAINESVKFHVAMPDSIRNDSVIFWRDTLEFYVKPVSFPTVDGEIKIITITTHDSVTVCTGLGVEIR